MTTEEELLLEWMPDLWKIKDPAQEEHLASEYSLSGQFDKYYEITDRCRYYSENGHILEIHIRKRPEFKSLPVWLTHFSHLKLLRIEECSLSSLQNLPSMMPELQHLYLFDNHLHSFLGFPKQLPKLQGIDISCNNFTTLQGFPKSCSFLRILCANENKLVNLEGLPVELPNLVHLNLTKNRLMTLEGLPLTLPALEHLDVSYNRLHHLWIDLHGSPNLTTFRIGDNRLRSLHGIPYHILRRNWGDLFMMAPYYPVSMAPYLKGGKGGNKRKQALYEEYLPTVAELVHKYITEQPLSDLQRDRIIFEGSADDMQEIAQTFPRDESIIPWLSLRLVKEHSTSNAPSS